MRVCVFIALVALAGPAGAGELEVNGVAGRLTIRAVDVTVADVMARLAESTGMRVVYDGEPPLLRLQRTLVDVTPAEAVTGLLDGLALRYAMALGDSRGQVTLLLITTVPVPPLPPGDDAPPASAVDVPEMEEVTPVAPSIDVPVPAVATPTAAPPPFTPQGPGPILLPPPPAPAAAQVAAPTPVPEEASAPSAALPPWMKAGYYGR